MVFIQKFLLNSKSREKVKQMKKYLPLTKVRMQEMNVKLKEDTEISILFIHFHEKRQIVNGYR